DVERRPDDPGLHVRAECPVHEIRIDGEALAPEYRIAVRLQARLDLGADPGIHVIGPGENEQTRSVLARAAFEHVPRSPAQSIVERAEGAIAFVHSARRLVRRQPRDRLTQSLEELLRDELRLIERDERRRVPDALLREHVAL